MANFKCPYCGKIFEALIQNIVNGDRKSCGCKSTTAKDITNQRFGKLIALYPTERRSSSGIIYWHCKCDCGNYTVINHQDFKSGKVKSCGCLSLEQKIERCKKTAIDFSTLERNINPFYKYIQPT